MFIRVKKIGAYEYLYLVENAREGGRHVQRVVKALGRRDEVEASGMLDALVASAARHSRRSIVLSRFYRGELAELRRVSIGPDFVFGRLWRETGCAEVGGALLVGRRFGFDVERAIYLTVLHRLMVSGSDRHASRARGDKALVSNKGFRRFVKTIGSGNFSIDYDKVEADAKFDGLFVLRTNTKLSALQVVLRYRNLLAVEDTFKTKALLTTRPIFHKTDAAIRGHIFCSFLAVLLRKELFDRLAARRHRRFRMAAHRR